MNSHLSRHSLIVVFLLLTGQAPACLDEEQEPQPKNRDARATVFQNIRWGESLTITHDTAKQVRWRLGIDQGGAGRKCSLSEGIRCLVLDGLWAFSIPVQVEEHPKVGAVWIFDDQKFQIVEILPVSGRPIGDSNLLISTANDRGAVLFNYSRQFGLEYVSLMAPGFDEDVANPELILDWPIQSVWVNRALYQCAAQE